MSMNRRYNTGNPAQGEAKRVLCVCSAGILRSPTAANVLHREFGYNTRSAGISEDFALIVVDDILCEWADEIVCMETWQVHLLDPAWERKVKCLNIPDDYHYMDKELQKLIYERYLATSRL